MRGEEEMELKTLDAFFQSDPVFKDSNVFSTDWKPDVFKYREEEYNALAQMFATHYQVSSNGFIYGPPGTGKTHIVQRLIEAFNLYTPPSNFKKKNDKPVKFIMINCRKRTFPEVFNDTLKALGGKTNNSNQTAEIGERVARFVKDCNICFIFDEADRMRPTKAHWTPVEDLVGIFTRFHEIHNTPSVSLILISNNPRLCDGLDDSTKSSFHAPRIKFKDYDVQQLYEILIERCALGFQPNIAYCGDLAEFAKTIRDGGYDLRDAFQALNYAGMNAKKTAVHKITLKNLKQSLKTIEMEMIAETIKDFDSTNFALYYVLASLQLVKQQRVERTKASVLVAHQEMKDVYKTDLWKGYQRLHQEFPEYFPIHSEDYLVYQVIKKMQKQGFVRVVIHGKGRGLGTHNTYELASRENPDESVTMQELEIINNALKVEMTNRTISKYERVEGGV